MAQEKMRVVTSVMTKATAAEMAIISAQSSRGRTSVKKMYTVARVNEPKLWFTTLPPSLAFKGAKLLSALMSAVKSHAHTSF